MKAQITIAALVVGFSTIARAQDVTPVTVDSFAQAESDLYFDNAIKEAGGIGKFFRNRAPVDLDKQLVIRMNRDTLYSSAVFDLDAGPVTITLPDPGKRLMSLEVISEEHYAPMVAYGPATITLSRDNVGTRYVMAAVRTLADPNDAADVKQVAALQDAITVKQPNGPGQFEPPHWNQQQQKEIRDALLVLAKYNSGVANAMGPKGAVDPIRHLIVTAAGWGANPDKDASYISVDPRSDGKTIFRMNVPAEVPVDGFWSVTVYNDKGFFEKNPYNAYSVNNITAKKNADGGVDIQFGGCDGKIPNCLPVSDGWNYTVRLYRPREEILTGKWSFPEARSVQ
ncbi:MAG: DUF1254 domain-containing protein [Rhizobium sp.]|nr:MAG: DUF1254 domain-containing protein [Rhizobium sp.]